MDEQTFASTAEAFGTNYGDGYLHLYQPSSGVSYYSTCGTVHLPVLHAVCTGHGWQQCSRHLCQRYRMGKRDEAKRLYLEGSILVSETVKTDFEKK